MKVKIEVMALCINCGVELDEGMDICPLCGKDSVNKVGQEGISDNYPSGIIRLQKKENIRYLWELAGIIAFSGIVVCTIVELLISKRLGWSLISDVSTATAWVVVTLLLFLNKKPFILVPLMMLTILTALFFIDLFTGAKGWFSPVGFPVTLASFIASAAILTLYRAAHFKGFNIIAAALLILSGFCIIIEIFLDKFIDNHVDLRWSLIAAVSVFPVSLILTFYHYRLKKGNKLDSFFHV